MPKICPRRHLQCWSILDGISCDKKQSLGHSPIGQTPGCMSRAIRWQERRGEIHFGSTSGASEQHTNCVKQTCLNRWSEDCLLVVVTLEVSPNSTCVAGSSVVCTVISSTTPTIAEEPQPSSPSDGVTATATTSSLATTPSNYATRKSLPACLPPWRVSCLLHL